MRDIFGRPNHESGTHIKGIVGEPDLKSMRRLFEAVKDGWPDEFAAWFRGKPLQKLAEKMSLTVRADLGVGFNLPTTNRVEAINRLLDMEAGKPELGRCELVQRLKNLFSSKLQEMSKVLFGLGSFELQPEHKDLFIEIDKRSCHAIVTEPGQAIPL